MRFSRRSSATPNLGYGQESTADTEASSDVLPIMFIEQNRENLNKSASSWQETAKIMTHLRTDETITSLVGSGTYWYAEGMGINLPNSQAASITSRYVEDMAMMCFLTARATANEGAFKSTLYSGRHLFDNLPGQIFHIATRKGGPATEYIESTCRMREKMHEGDKQAHAILQSFVRNYSASPESINILAELYEEGAESINKGFAELREIIRTDWYAQNSSDSILRNFIDSLEDEPNLFIDTFIEKIVRAEGDRRAQIVRNMARLALARSGEPETPANLAGVLYETRKSWSSFEEIDTLYMEFRKQSFTAIRSSMDKIAGLATDSNPRLPKTTSDLAHFKSLMQLGIEGRENRRKRQNIKNKSATALRPHIDASLVDESRFSRVDKPIYFARKISESSLRKEACDHDTITEFVSGMVDKLLVADIVLTIKKINENPLSSASAILRSGAGKVNIEGKKVRLRRFKPQLAPDLSISPEATNYRTCYGLVDGSVVIVDILNHDQFDKKYS